ncbi:Ubiquitin-conjugating enzyme E2 6 [Ascosphaera acerosa]|nr:Ubiquitin-conjugating enzyme E2 6 [Ascosphaera acerosa]
MATKAAYKRLTREYQRIQESPPPYIEAHPSESNILEWHYLITGPPDTPYENGQYWGTLMFPQEYPFAPPAIRMHTPSGRFQPSARLCLSISDFHPRSFNPAWEVSTILIGLLSFMTSEEMTTGSVGATAHERKLLAARSRWWNSTGGGTSTRQTVRSPSPAGVTPATRKRGKSATKAAAASTRGGDGGAKFRAEWPDQDEANWKWMEDNRIDVATGTVVPLPAADTEAEAEVEATGIAGTSANASATAGTGARPSAAGTDSLVRLRDGSAAAAALRPRLSSIASSSSVRDRGHAARDAGQGFIRRNKLWIGLAVILGYAVLVRIFDDVGGA